jgi:hypothetical protein
LDHKEKDRDPYQGLAHLLQHHQWQAGKHPHDEQGEQNNGRQPDVLNDKHHCSHQYHEQDLGAGIQMVEETVPRDVLD